MALNAAQPDSGANETTFSAADELKREVTELLDVVSSEPKAEFCDTAGRLH